MQSPYIPHLVQAEPPGFAPRLRAKLVKRMEEAFGVRANAVRVNYYRNNKAGRRLRAVVMGGGFLVVKMNGWRC